MDKNCLWHSVYCAEGMSAKKLAKLYNEVRSLNLDACDVASLKAEDLSHEFNLEYGLSKSIIKSVSSKKHKNGYEKLLRKNIELLLPEDRQYPDKIKSFYKNSPILYITGNKKHLSSSSIGVSGSREATSEGLKTSYNVAKAASKKFLTVVSGLAKGG